MVIGVLVAVLTLTVPGLAGCTSSGSAAPGAQLQAHVADGWLRGCAGLARMITVSA
jgi:hypothetical protein